VGEYDDDEIQAIREENARRIKYGHCDETIPVMGVFLTCELTAGHKHRDRTDHYVTLRWGNSLLLVRQGANG
jgi:hypothetical protein